MAILVSFHDANKGTPYILANIGTNPPTDTKKPKQLNGLGHHWHLEPTAPKPPPHPNSSHHSHKTKNRYFLTLAFLF
jgi:hypothetical protein